MKSLFQGQFLPRGKYKDNKGDKNPLAFRIRQVSEFCTGRRINAFDVGNKNGSCLGSQTLCEKLHTLKQFRVRFHLAASRS